MELLERESALAELAEAHEAATRGEGRVVVVGGEAGIGKTSLVAHFATTVERGSRVLWGTCDDLAIPRPLGPVRDLASADSPDLERALSADASPAEVQGLLVAELERPPPPVVLVLEDLHWADDATLDVVTVVARRIARLPTLLVVTLRPGETPTGGRLDAVLGAIPPALARFVELEPLSARAVAELAGEDADRVLAATGGNPFYVTELLAARPATGLPASVAAAVLGRAARLDDASRRLVELVSVVPGRASTAVLDVVEPGWTAAAEEPERRGLLEIRSRSLRFRHELARLAIESSVPMARRRRLHGEVLDALLALGGDPAEIVHHAEAADAEDVVARQAPIAARRAAAVESNREAYSHYRRAADFADRHPLPERAALLEELALAAYTVGRLEEAFWAIERAIAAQRELGADEAVGRCLRLLSRFHWYYGNGEEARATAERAIATLEPLGPSAELARAYSARSQLAMLADRSSEAVEWGAKALELATAVGDHRTRAHALVNIGATRPQLRPEDAAELLEAHELADAVGDRHEATRALLNLGYMLMAWMRPGPAVEQTERALAYALEHEVDTLASYAATTLAWLRLRAGEWDEAERTVARELERGSDVAQLLAKTVRAEIAVRRGDPDAEERLADVGEQADRSGELQRIEPVLELEAEWALTRGGPLPVARFDELAAAVTAPEPTGDRTFLMRAAAWARVVGVDLPYAGEMSVLHRAMAAGDWRAAADAFGAVGWEYDRALMLSLLDDADALAEALSLARGLGAAPLTERVSRRLRELGLPVPHGVRRTTRANPLGLTDRQLEVLELLAAGLTNAEIAERLVVSPRTAEHHVAAVLAKLGVSSRRDAARRAAKLGVPAAR